MDQVSGSDTTSINVDMNIDSNYRSPLDTAISAANSMYGNLETTDDDQNSPTDHSNSSESSDVFATASDCDNLDTSFKNQNIFW